MTVQAFTPVIDLKVRNAPSGYVLNKISHQSHNARIANRHLRGKGERNKVQRRTIVIFRYNHDASTVAAAVGEKAHLQTKQHLTVKKSSL